MFQYVLAIGNNERRRKKTLTALLQLNDMTLASVEYHAHVATIAGT
jgi:hypothetical protein